MNTQQVGTLSASRARRSQPFKIYISSFNVQVLKEIAAFIFVFALGMVAVYFLPQFLAKIFFLGILILFWFSNKDYFWFALFFAIVQSPGMLFSGTSTAVSRGLPDFTLLPNISLTPLDLFVGLSLVKAFIKGKKVRLELRKPLLLILTYVTLSACISAITGTPLADLAADMRGVFYYTVVISFFSLIKSRKEVYSFIWFIFPFVFFIFFTQVYYIITSENFINLFVPGLRRTQFIAGSEYVRPFAFGLLLQFFAFIFAFFLIEIKKNVISERLLYVIIGVSYCSVIVSSTRIWFFLYSTFILGYLLFTKKSRTSLLKLVFVMVLLGVLLIGSGIIQREFFIDASLPRLAGLLQVARGDFESVGTFNNRLLNRFPRVWEGAKKHLVFGAGYSDVYIQHYDVHVGFFNTILQFGILGSVFFLYFFYFYLNLIYKTVKSLNTQNSLRNSLKILGLSFFVFLLGTFTTWTFFPMDWTTNIPFFIGVFLGLTEFFIREAKTEELEMRSQ